MKKVYTHMIIVTGKGEYSLPHTIANGFTNYSEAYKEAKRELESRKRLSKDGLSDSYYSIITKLNGVPITIATLSDSSDSEYLYMYESDCIALGDE